MSVGLIRFPGFEDYVEAFGYEFACRVDVILRFRDELAVVPWHCFLVFQNKKEHGGN